MSANKKTKTLRLFYQALKQPSIRVYLILMNLILLCLLFPSISFLFLNEEAKFRDLQLNRTIGQLRKSLESRGTSLARSMALSANQAIAGYDFTFLNIMVNQVTADDPEISYSIIMDTNRRVITHSDQGKIGSILDGPIDNKVIDMMYENFPITADIAGQSSYIKFLDHNIQNGEQSVPVMEAIKPLYHGEKLWGLLRLGYSLRRLNAEIDIANQEWLTKMKQFKVYLYSMTAVFFFLGVIVAALFTRSFVRSVKVLSTGVNKISEGDLDHKIHQNGLVCSEVMDLSYAFNEMTNKLRSSYKKLDEYSRSLELKVDERTKELQEAQANLMRHAHEAGMAEMAVGILHNIGNAITPAKVTATLMAQKIKNSPVRQHLPEFMTQLDGLIKQLVLPDKEKKRLAELVELLPQSLNEEFEQYAEDVDQIRDKHEHIEGIINLQMRYARLFGDYEEVDINQITQDALKMLNDSLRKRAVNITTKTKDVPRVKIEQAKLIQIIVNLIKNAYESMDNLDKKDKQIFIQTDYEDGPPACVVFSIKDNGVGFTKEEKEKMFMFGYTSKDKGSGFGLHSCANYLIANNGSITARSNGKGEGAEFVIRLAVDPEKRKGNGN